MQANVNNSPTGKVFYDESSVRQLMSILSVSSVQPDRFYLTGYETIFFDATREFLLESLLTSVMSFDKELIIVELSDGDLVYEQLCDRHDISYRKIVTRDGQIDFVQLEDWLVNSRRHSHLLISGDILRFGEHLIHKLGTLLARYRRSLIVDCGSNPLLLKDVFQYHVDFMIANDYKFVNRAVVVAKRSKLVQVEGNARTATYDLYAHWQSSMRSRGSSIEPMSA